MHTYIEYTGWDDDKKVGLFVKALAMRIVVDVERIPREITINNRRKFS